MTLNLWQKGQGQKFGRLASEQYLNQDKIIRGIQEVTKIKYLSSLMEEIKT